jgi:ketosteroid isomerase-like protein
MNNIEEKQIIKLLQEYAFLLNSAHIDLIPTFYTEDGLFMPDGLKNLTRLDITKRTSGNFLKKINFKIEYTAKSIVVQDSYAFVLAAAKTSTKNALTGDINEKTSRDFFVLRKESDNWKIYRYMFNNVLNVAS